jgi:hypothetical protein
VQVVDERDDASIIKPYSYFQGSEKCIPERFVADPFNELTPDPSLYVREPAGASSSCR